MELVSTEVSTLKSLRLPWQEMLLMPIGDVQFGSAECDVDRFKRHIDWAVEQENVYLIGMGDYVDFGSPSNRRKLKAMVAEGQLYDTAADVMDEAAQEHLEQLQEILEPTKGRWLGLVEGHHLWEFQDGTTSDTRLCQFLKAPFLGTCAIVEVRFVRPGDRHRAAFQVWAHHGKGSGMMQGAPLNKLEAMMKAFPTVDVFLLAHHHKKVGGKVQQLIPRFLPSGNHKLDHRNVVIAGTGGFLKGYMAGSRRNNRAMGAYPERGMMMPVALGGIVIYARPRFDERGTGNASVDLDVSI